MNETSAAHAHAVFLIPVLPDLAGFGRLAPMDGHWSQKGVNIEKSCVVPLVRSIEIVCVME